MPKLLFLLLCFCMSMSLSAQRYLITGYVTGPANDSLLDCRITIGRFNTTTNSNGYFTIRTDLLPDVLNVQHVRYAEKDCFLNLPPLGDTTFLSIRLEEKHTDLEEVRITANRVIWAYPKKNVHILDFNLRDDGMLLLCKDRKQYLLRQVNASGKPVFDLPLDDHPLNLYRDCEDQTHVVFSDSVFRIAFRNDSLLLCDGQTLEEADQTLAPCVAAIGSKKIWRSWGPYGKSIQLLVSDTLTHKVRNFYLAENRHYLRWVKEYEYDVAHGAKSMKDPDQNAYTDIQERTQAAMERQRIADFYSGRPAYVPVYILRDSLVVLDHLNDTAFVYTPQGRLVRSYPILYQYHKHWDHQLILNEEGTRIFARFDYRGMTHLFEVNTNTGELMNETVLEEHIYPTKIQIKGDFVYYIYHFYVDNSINYVYKQRIQDF